MNSVNKQNRERVISDWVFYSQSTSMVISGRWRRDRQTHRQTDRDRDRQTETETDRDTERERERERIKVRFLKSLSGASALFLLFFVCFIIIIIIIIVIIVIIIIHRLIVFSLLFFFFSCLFCRFIYPVTYYNIPTIFFLSPCISRSFTTKHT